MPFGAIKDIVSRGGRKAAKSGKRAYGAAKEYDQKMVEAHGETDSPSQAFGLGDRDDAPEIGLGIGGGGDRYENDPSFPFGESEPLGGGMGGDESTSGRTLEVEYRGSTDDWAVMTGGGYPLSTYKTKEAAVSKAKSRISGGGEFTDYTVRRKQSSDSGFGLF